MSWSHIFFYYTTQITALVATTEDANYPATNLLDGLDSTLYKGLSTATHYLTAQDLGVSNGFTADYLAFAGDNLAGATVALQFSNDNFSSDVREAFTAFVRSGSDPVVKEYTSISGRYSRLKLTGLTANPFIADLRWGLKTDLDYADAGFDPHGRTFKGNINVSETGYLTGVHKKFIERDITIKFLDADDTLYQKLSAWWDAIMCAMFYVAWEKTDHASDIWFVRADPKFQNPLKSGGAFRDITLPLKGRK